MRTLFSLLIGITVLFSLSACGDMIDSLRKESREVDEEVERDREKAEDSVANYKPKTLNGLSANNVPEYQPPAARNYGKKTFGKAAAALGGAGEGLDATYHRVTRDDFVDRDIRENSLWDGQGQTNYLFANNRRREVGDVLTADVEKDLRREIQYQLWMTLPPEQRKVRKPAAGNAQNSADSLTNAASGAAKAAAGNGAADAAKKAGADKGQEAKAKDAAEEAAKTNMAPSSGDDLIRMEVVENLGNGLMRVLGQKRVVYRGVSRVVEVTALVNNKDIEDGNKTKSSNFLDMKAQVIQ